MNPRIAIVGAGVGGLACARALQVRGYPVTVFERDVSWDARWQGGMLDLHVPTGQAALRAAGLFDEFRAVARAEGQELWALDAFTAALLHHEQPRDDELFAPEIDRGQLRDLFLDALTPGTIRWGFPIDTVTPLDEGTALLSLRDGTSEDFDLVIGADGAWSRIRPAVSSAMPSPTGDTMIETWLDDVDTRHPALARLVGKGSMLAKSAGMMLSAQRNSGGHVRVYATMEVPAEWPVDFADTAAVREYLLAKFAGWHESLLELLRHHDGGFINRPLHVLPVGHTWEHMPGVTLLGDAAHLMPPYGIGANLALLDGTDLATAISTHNDLDEAVRAYEHTMLPRSAEAAQACAELTATLAADLAHHVDDTRKLLNERLLHPRTALANTE